MEARECGHRIEQRASQFERVRRTHAREESWTAVDDAVLRALCDALDAYSRFDDVIACLADARREDYRALEEAKSRVP